MSTQVFFFSHSDVNKKEGGSPVWEKAWEWPESLEARLTRRTVFIHGTHEIAASSLLIH